MNIRSQIENRQRFTGTPEDTGLKTLFLVCLFSLACHLFFFISLFFLHDFEFFSSRHKVVTVDLVTFSPEPANAQALGKSPEFDEPAPDNGGEINPDAVSEVQPQIAGPREPEIPILKPEVSLKSKPDNLKDLIAARKREVPRKKPPIEKPAEKKKKADRKAGKKLEPDLAKIKKEQAKKRDAQFKKALERMKASVASKEHGARGTNSGGNGADAGGGGGETSPLTLYQMVIKSAIEQNWVFNDAMAGLNQDLEVRIFIKILKSGDIRDISFETRSGNHYLDASAKKAVQRANPLPKLPKGMSSYELVLGFSPRGLK